MFPFISASIPTLFQEKAVQHVSSTTFTWSSFSSAQAKDMSSIEGSGSREHQRIGKWSVDKVASHVKSLGCADQARIFAEQVYSSKVWLHHFANFSIRTFKPHHAICTAAVRTWAKFQIASVNESEDRDVWSFTQSHTNLSYLASVPNFRKKH